MAKTLVQEQFGKTAQGYLTSKPHAQGKSLDCLVALTTPQKSWRMLDIATGAGHVAYAFAPHHFDSIAEFLSEARRVLAPKGTFALVDNVVPAGSVGDYINAFERFRDPSHLRAWAMEEWRAALATAGFAVAHEEQLPKTMEFSTWAARHDATMQALLRSMLIEVTPDVRAVLAPEEKAGQFTFRLSEGMFIAKAA